LNGKKRSDCLRRERLAQRMQRGQKTGRPTEKRAYWRASFTSFIFVSTLLKSASLPVLSKCVN
jgi:hypothetical protein